MEKFAAERFYLTGCWLTSCIEAAEQENLDTEQLKKWLSMMRNEFQAIGLGVSVRALDSASRCASDQTQIHNLREALRVLQQTIRWEMQDHVFMHLNAERASFYDKPELFGVEVNKKFSN